MLHLSVMWNVPQINNIKKNSFEIKKYLIYDVCVRSMRKRSGWYAKSCSPYHVYGYIHLTDCRRFPMKLNPLFVYTLHARKPLKTHGRRACSVFVDTIFTKKHVPLTKSITMTCITKCY